MLVVADGLTDLFSYRSFMRCVEALVFLRMTSRRHSSASETRASAVILSACRRESASSLSCCPAAHDQACSLLPASKCSSMVFLGLCQNLWTLWEFKMNGDNSFFGFGFQFPSGWSLEIEARDLLFTCFLLCGKRSEARGNWSWLRVGGPGLMRDCTKFQL